MKLELKYSKMIKVKPNGGLGNRLRVIHSVMSLQSIMHVPVTILWEKNRHLNCDYDALFEVSEMIEVIELKKNPFYQVLAKMGFSKQIHDFQLRKYDKVLFDKEVTHLRDNGYDFLNLMDYSSVFIETCEWFFTKTDGTFFFPKPNQDIQKTVKKITETFTPKL